MIRISANLADGLFALTVVGHEEHVADGRICSAVSAITQTALLGLAQIAEQHPDVVSVEIKEN